MQMFKDMLYKENEWSIAGFVNASDELEYSVYKQVDGGYIDLEDRECDKDGLLEFLETELDDFAKLNVSSSCILGHDIRVKLPNGKLVSESSMDDEVYEISQSILDGVNCGEIFIESLKVKASWNVIS